MQNDIGSSTSLCSRRVNSSGCILVALLFKSTFVILQLNCHPTIFAHWCRSVWECPQSVRAGLWLLEDGLPLVQSSCNWTFSLSGWGCCLQRLEPVYSLYFNILFIVKKLMRWFLTLPAWVLFLVNKDEKKKVGLDAPVTHSFLFSY